jgi:peptidoglycan/xylan/chitin deacetylase (PgdA/CDA1 family)
VIVLFYHRIADDRANDWTAPCAIFEKQVDWLRQHFEMVSLAEAQSRLRAGHNERPCVTITFDDGYADNSLRALPLLLNAGIPFTYFVSSQHVLSGTPFGHDVDNGWPLAPNTPDQIQELARAGVEIGAHTRHHVDLGRVNDPQLLFDELVVGQQELEDLCSVPVRYFAFPFGQHANLSTAAFRLAREHYDGVCSAYGGVNFPGDDPFHIQRVPVGADLVRLQNWATLDPRKLRMARRYQPERRAEELARAGGEIS